MAQSPRNPAHPTGSPASDLWQPCLLPPPALPLSASWMHGTGPPGSRGHGCRGSQETQKEGGDGLREGAQTGQGWYFLSPRKRAHLSLLLKACYQLNCVPSQQTLC